MDDYPWKYCSLMDGALGAVLNVVVYELAEEL